MTKRKSDVNAEKCDMQTFQFQQKGQCVAKGTTHRTKNPSAFIIHQVASRSSEIIEYYDKRMDSETIIETCEGAIKTVRYNKPKRKNAIDVNMYLRITKILNDAAVDENISVMVLTGTGDYYSSGNDLSASVDADRNSSLLQVLKDFINAFITFPKILVAIVNGPAIGVAATTLALCDLVFASETAFFYTPFSKLGIVAEGCSTLTFPRLLGDRKATEMLLFSQKMSAKEALQFGFVNYLYKPEELQSKVWDMIMEVSQYPEQSLLVIKRLLRRTLKDELIKTNEIEMDELQKVWRSSAYQSNVSSFVRKSKSKL